jgi:hypothetical protein
MCGHAEDVLHPDPGAAGPLARPRFDWRDEQARRHTHTGLVLSRSRAAISPMGSCCSNISAACNRTRSRAARPRAVRAPPSAYLMYTA